MIIDKLSFSYNDKPVYKDFSLRIDEGKVCCVMGNSGGGKTTLLNCISGQLAYGGSIFYGQYADKHIDEIVISYVFQQPRLIPSLTVKGNIEFVLFNEDKATREQKSSDIIKKLALEDCANSYPSEISGGQASRAALARALVKDCDVLLMDEPFKGLDIKLKRQILDYLLPLIKNKTVIFVTHDVEEALVAADKIVVISNDKDGIVRICEQVEIDVEREKRDLYSQKLNTVRKIVTDALLDKNSENAK